MQACRSLGGHETPQILTDQLTLSQQGGTNYTHHITTGPPGFLDRPTALHRASSVDKIDSTSNKKYVHRIIERV